MDNNDVPSWLIGRPDGLSDTELKAAIRYINASAEKRFATESGETSGLGNNPASLAEKIRKAMPY